MTGMPNWRANAVKFLHDNPTLALTSLYLYTVGIGLLYSATLYGSFGINVFDYSEIADFLFAAFKNPIVLLVAGGQAVGLLGLLSVLSHMKLIEEDSEDLEHFRRLKFLITVTLWVGVITILLFSLVGPYVFAKGTASSIRDGENPKVEVRYRSFKGSAGQVTVTGLQLIGATQRASFFYDVDDQRTLVIPQAQLVSIEVPE